MRILVLAALISPAAAQFWAHKSRPAFVEAIDFDADAVPPEGQGANGAYLLLMDIQEDLGNHDHYVHSARKVVSESGLESVSRISVDFSPSYETVEFHRIAIWRKGAVRELLPRLKPTLLHREQDLEMSGMLNGRRTLLFTLEDVRLGDIVDYEYTLRGDNPIFGGKASGSAYLRFGVPVERLRIRLVHSRDALIYIAGLHGAGEGRLEAAGKGWARVWDEKRLAPLEYESGSPYWYENHPRVQWSQYADWSAVSDWAVGMYPFSAPFSRELSGWVERHSSSDAQGKVRAALKLVQDSVRYLGLEIGVSSHQPAAPSLVYSRRFGDCKDKVFLFCSLLRRMGMECEPALVNTTVGPKVADYQPSPLAFNHVIAKVALDGRAWWFDCTHQGLRGDPFSNQGLPYGKALVVKPGNFDFDDIVLAENAGGMQEFSHTIIVKDWDSSAALTVTSVYTGNEAERIRAQFRDGNREEMKKAYREYMARAYSGIRVEKPLELEDEPEQERFTVREYYSVDSLCGREAATGRRTCEVFPVNIAPWVEKPVEKSRTGPYGLAYPKVIRETIVLRTPEPLETETDSRILKQPDFHFNWNESAHGTHLRMEYAYTALADHVPPGRFGNYWDGMRAINENLGATFYPGSGFPDNLNYLLAVFALGCLGAGAWAARRLLRMETPKRPFPAATARPISGLLILVGLGLVFRPVLILYGASYLLTFLDQGKWNALTVQGADNYHPLWAPMLLAETLGVLVSLVLAMALLPLFFRRKATFPKAFLIVISVALATEAIGLGGLLLIQGMADQSKEIAEFFRNVLVSLAWMAYLFKSDRVRETFVLPLIEPEASPVPDQASRTGFGDRQAQGHSGEA